MHNPVPRQIFKNSTKNRDSLWSGPNAHLVGQVVQEQNAISRGKVHENKFYLTEKLKYLN